jgi:hypothetical protein
MNSESFFFTGSYSNSEIKISGHFEPVYIEKLVSLTICLSKILKIAEFEGQITRLDEHLH